MKLKTKVIDMPRPKKELKLSRSRPKKPIDWNMVDKLLEAGCNGAEVASNFDMHPTTFYDRVLIEKGMIFTHYQAEKKYKGDSLLRRKQFQIAMEGEKTLLIWLGKQRLDQSEPDNFHAPKVQIVASRNPKHEQKPEEDKNDSSSVEI